MPARLKTHYEQKVVPQLKEKFNYENTMQVPKLHKIVLNMGLGKLSDAGKDYKLIEDAASELSLIVGQKAVITRAKNSIAGFKLREKSAVGCMVTLRGSRMYEFFDRLVSIALPRVRDFRGTSAKAFDGNGNYTLGLRDQTIFPEIDYNKVEKTKGMNISIITTAINDEQAKELLIGMGMPLVKQ
ncbi:MAG: 50S ribosomal protein L5 [Candidatus Dadabacteria bacterium]|nr:50S ribosomal protein L5 [Candidatus Dadabacteria bacterium]NIS08359.1 50S ribosomal protein L5 [Candidatus Dadabacteria bacterium]NIV42220.1 50S ribosomal protein L5 [Candidatus Dadabacteria bacterium]NIX16397.1 50S ribosomal protein L5 [Candidatus Dadabacteria bacterium]NIY21876.1 50S ribosomal protein L5 [Candidatus Dadabacteria bacterium]